MWNLQITYKHSRRTIEAWKYLSWQFNRFQQLYWSHSNSFEWWDMHEHKMLTGATQVSSERRVVEWKFGLQCGICRNEFLIFRSPNMQCEACKNECSIIRKLKSHIGTMQQERSKSLCKCHCEICENKALVAGKLKEHKWELLEARNMFINVKLVTKCRTYRNI